MTTIKHPEKLKKGDIILYAGTNIISRIINYFDESKFSHAALYIGDEKVMESSLSGGGCKVNELTDSMDEYDEVIVKRHANEHELDMSRVIRKAQQFLDSGYDVIQIIQLGLIGLNRKISRYNWSTARLWNRLLDHMCEASLKKYQNGDERTVCSEFVYRCYHDVILSDTDKYEILVGNAGKHIVDGKEKFKIANRFIEPGGLASIYFPEFSYDPQLTLFDRLQAPQIPNNEKQILENFEKFSEVKFNYFDDVPESEVAVEFKLSKEDELELEELFEEMKRESKTKKIKAVDQSTHEEIKEKLLNFMILNSPIHQYDHEMMSGLSEDKQKSLSRNSYLVHRQHFVTAKDLVYAENLIDVDC